jgi:hypothetical protein
MSFPAEFELLSSVPYLYLRRLSEPSDNWLRLVVEEAISNISARGQFPIPENPELSATVKDIWPIEPIKGGMVFELYWKKYGAYLVTEETAGSCGEYEDEVYRGKTIRGYGKSHFLEHLACDTGGHSDPLRHYKIICLNHLIDVASYAPPEIRLLIANEDAKVL